MIDDFAQHVYGMYELHLKAIERDKTAGRSPVFWEKLAACKRSTLGYLYREHGDEFTDKFPVPDFIEKVGQNG